MFLKADFGHRNYVVILKCRMLYLFSVLLVHIVFSLTLSHGLFFEKTHGDRKKYKIIICSTNYFGESLVREKVLKNYNGMLNEIIFIYTERNKFHYPPPPSSHLKKVIWPSTWLFIGIFKIYFFSVFILCLPPTL